MLTFFRRIIFTRIGGIIAIAIVAVIGIGFALSDTTGLGSSRLGAGDTTTAATVGNDKLTTGEVINSTTGLLEMYRQQPQGQGLDMPRFIAQGGFDGPLESRLSGMAMQQFAMSQGMRIGPSLIGNQISNIPGLRGLDGKIDTASYNRFLGTLRMTDAQMKAQISRDLLTQLLMGPINTDATKKLKAPLTLATPYASMLLEKRTGTMAFVDTKKMPGGAAPSDAEAQAYYKANIARFTVPERRSAQYIMISLDELKKRATPTDEELATAYKSQPARFAAGETRSLKQVVLLDQKSATDLVAKVRGGTAIDVAAKAAGLEAATIADVAKTAYAAQTSSPALADQVFAAASGAVIGPVKTPLGWTVVHLDKITAVQAKTLEQAKPDLAKDLTQLKMGQVAQDVRDQIEDAIAKNQTLAEIGAALKLPVAGVTPLTADGRDPDAAKPVAPDQKLIPLYQVAFTTKPEDDPQMIPIGQDGSFALVKLDKVIAAAPRPFATVAEDVGKNIIIDRQVKAARDVANGIQAKVNKGVPLAKAMAETGIALDSTKPMAANRAQLFTAQKAPPPLVLLFSKPRGTASVLEAPYKGGWFIVVVDSVERGNAAGKADVVEKMRGDLGNGMGEELRQQFVRAIREKVGIKKNDEALKKAREQLLGKGNDDQPQ